MNYLAKLDDPAASNGKDTERVIVLQRDGCILYVGCNAISNEKIIGEHPHQDCLALHAWGAKGSYVVLCAGNLSQPFTDDIILFAAQTALKHSRSELRTVTYCRISELFKPEGAQPGVFRHNRSAKIEV